MKLRGILFLILGISLAVLISAQVGEQEIDNFSLNAGWNLVYGFNDPSQIIGAGSGSYGESFDNNESVSLEEIQNSIELIYVYNQESKEYVLLYAKKGTKESDEYKNFNLPKDMVGNIPTSVMWVYSERRYSIKYKADEYPLLSERNLIKGWNFIPIAPEISGYSINEIKGNCDYEKVYTYAEEDGVSQWIDLINNLDDKRMMEESSAAGLQLVIKIKDDCKMSI